MLGLTPVPMQALATVPLSPVTDPGPHDALAAVSSCVVGGAGPPRLSFSTALPLLTAADALRSLPCLSDFPHS